MIVEQYQDRESWLAARGLSGTRVSRILGHGGSPWGVWAECQPGYVPDTTETEIMREGHEFQDFGIRLWGSRTGTPVEPVDNLIVRHPSFAWATASPDGFSHGRTAGIEMKTDRNPERWGASGAVIERFSLDSAEIVPEAYLTQVYWCLECSGLDRWTVLAMLPRPWGMPELRIYTVKSDPDHQRRMLLRVAQWRKRHIVDGVMPAIDDSDACAAWFGRPMVAREPLRAATDAESDLVAELVYLDAALDQLESRRKLVRAELTAAVGDAQGLATSTCTVKFISNRGQPKLDRKKLADEFPEAFAACMSRGAPFRYLRVAPIRESK